MHGIVKSACALVLAAAAAVSPVFASEGPTLHKSASYSSGQYNVDGGVMEIIAYNKATGWAYSVNGQSGLLTALDLDVLAGNGSGITLSGTDYDIKAMVEDEDPSFSYGDMTSVAVSPDGSRLALALQDVAYDKTGRAAIFSCAPDGSISLESLIECGVQPDMVTFADNVTVLTADEGEPRMGYGDGIVDPAGSVSIMNIDESSSTVVGFEAFDSTEARQALVDEGVVIMKGRLPSVDFEPEYIAVSGGKAYVTLQEANAVAVLDIPSKSFDGIYSVGFEDYSKTPVDIDKKDEAYAPRTYDGLMGIRMPDGISAFTSNGKTYLVTANEGDAREWGDEDDDSFYLSEDERDFGDGDASPTGRITAASSGLKGKVVFFRTADFDGLAPDNDYLFGGRTFTIYEVGSDGLSEVYSSQDAFERMSAERHPAFYNASNDNAFIDDRSGKKGPEPESVTTGVIDGRTYAFIALERTGGVMMYDVTDPAQAVCVDYLNPRDFLSIVEGSEEYDDGELDKWVTGGDVAPEGLCFIAAGDSPTGRPAILVANEVSGTVSFCEIY